MSNNPLDYSTYSDAYVNSLVVERDRWRGRTLDAERNEQNAQEAAKQLRYERDHLWEVLENIIASIDDDGTVDDHHVVAARKALQEDRDEL